MTARCVKSEAVLFLSETHDEQKQHSDAATHRADCTAERVLINQLTVSAQSKPALCFTFPSDCLEIQ